jgi:hypothetical protein
MENSIIGYFILGGSVTTIVTLLTILFTYGRKLIFPKGHRFQINKDGFKLHLIVDHDIEHIKNDDDSFILHDGEKIKISTLLDACHKAATISKKTFVSEGFKDGKTKEAMIWFRLDENFEEVKPGHHAWWADWIKKVNAFAEKPSRRMLGSGPGLIVSRAKFIKPTIERGQPVIHEMYHVLMLENHTKHWRWDSGHKNEKVWATFGKDTAEFKAQELFKSGVKHL